MSFVYIVPSDIENFVLLSYGHKKNHFRYLSVHKIYFLEQIETTSSDDVSLRVFLFDRQY